MPPWHSIRSLFCHHRPPLSNPNSSIRRAYDHPSAKDRLGLLRPVFTPLSIRERGVIDEKTRVHFITMFNDHSPYTPARGLSITASSSLV
ncbi:hypothetical protein CDAR_189381 [Caerostris darwini]|uniref:Uncharacterized protein n=1 Tax=Caerostris darwini TaxID=1538125 RepID=A0AAV4PSP9_9ARAC|nr:hypothetical protein CDAR_189381 [Caerostris darwini]